TAGAEVRAGREPADVAVDAAGVIDPEVAARRQPVQRVPVGVQRADEAVDVLRDRLLEDVAGGEGAVTPQRVARRGGVVLEPRAAEAAGEQAGGVVVVLR